MQALGWNHFFQQQMVEAWAHLIPARVCRQDINQYHLLTVNGPLTGQIPGRLRQQTSSKADLPCVGDWVLVSRIKGGDQGQVVIEVVLNRRSKFSRKEAGLVADEQIIAANMDAVFIVNGLDEDFNPNRIERYLLLTRDSGALPVIVLNKRDLCADEQELNHKLKQLDIIARGTSIFAVSALSGAGIDALRKYIQPGTTCALIGSSGVGKSTIINSLIGYTRFNTGAVRASDGKGRHTTTFREMIQISGGGLIIDTPGMRELQVWADEFSLNQSFADIEALSRQCRFADCGHQNEPDCAVMAAIKHGDLAAERLNHYRKFRRELTHLEERHDASARVGKKPKRKRLSRQINNQPDQQDD